MFDKPQMVHCYSMDHLLDSGMVPADAYSVRLYGSICRSGFGIRTHSRFYDLVLRKVPIMGSTLVRTFRTK